MVEKVLVELPNKKRISKYRHEHSFCVTWTGESLSVLLGPIWEHLISKNCLHLGNYGKGSKVIYTQNVFFRRTIIFSRSNVICTHPKTNKLGNSLISASDKLFIAGYV